MNSRNKQKLKNKIMKTTKIEIKEEIIKVKSEIIETQKNLKNSKDYLKYLKECFEDEKKVAID